MKLIFLITTLFFLASCSRESSDYSSLMVQLPEHLSKNKVAGLGFQDDVAKICYAVNVVGPGLPAGSNACGPVPGVFSAFMPAGSQLELLVPNGTGRTVELYMLALNATNDTCPKWDQACDSKFNCGVYKVGQKTNVDTTKSETIVEILLDFKNWNDHVVKQSAQPNLCAGKVEVALNTDGVIKDKNQIDIFNSESHPTNESIAYDKNQITTFSTLGIAKQDSSFVVAKFVRSVTQKPDTKLYYGLIGEGQVVEVLGNGNIKYLDSNCPFSTCRVPSWIAAISPGMSRNLYGLDHAGNIYRFISANQLEKLSHKVPPYVQHLANY
ncbi:MAG: hypothetical protein H6625_03730 [Bdellovibrionaceae bacterium]|nr:hypothetical protein [Pseudobdellovibrionaceae bacterium]